MRRIYLIRHGRPDVSEQGSWCIGGTDLELGTLGRMQARLLAYILEDAELTHVFCSPLVRSIQTAKYLSMNPTILSGLREQDFGEWDGKSFEEIRRNWPELYEARGQNRSLLPPGAEPAEAVQQRVIYAVTEAMEHSEGDIAIVAHQSVMGTLLCYVLGEDLCNAYKYRFGYGSVTVLECECSGEAVCTREGAGCSGDVCAAPVKADCECSLDQSREQYGRKEKNALNLYQMRLCEMAQPPLPMLSESVCKMLLHESGQPDGVIAHCALVAELTRRFCQELMAVQPQKLNWNLAIYSAWLHDLARTQPHHAQTAANWLEQLGYTEAAKIVGQHHSLQNPGLLDEAALVCLADCCAEGDRQVTIEQRFAKSRKKCKDAAGLREHQRRYGEVAALKEKLNKQCGREVIR